MKAVEQAFGAVLIMFCGKGEPIFAWVWTKFTQPLDAVTGFERRRWILGKSIFQWLVAWLVGLVTSGVVYTLKGGCKVPSLGRNHLHTANMVSVVQI